MLTGDTSLLTIESSAHGRLRRAQRNIDKKDLQAALKYGVKEHARPCRKTGAKRWKYTFRHIVYITEETEENSSKEITSWIEPMPLPEVFVTPEEIANQEKISERLARNPQMCTSHTILIVDHSASMATSDIPEYRHRSDAVYCCLAIDFLSEQLHSGNASPSDVVTLIEMRDQGTVAFSFQPISNALINMMIQRRTQYSSWPRSHGNYIPSLILAEEILNKHINHPHCALVLMLLSDGKPSDKLDCGYETNTQLKYRRMMRPYIHSIAAKFNKQLVVQTIAFSNSQFENEFLVLKDLADYSSELGARGSFVQSSLKDTNLGITLTSLSSNLTQTRTQLTTVMFEKRKRTLRNVFLLAGNSSTVYHAGHYWNIYPHSSLFAWRWDKLNEYYDWRRARFFNSETQGVAISEDVFGEGAERIVFLVQEIKWTEDKSVQFLGQPLAGKETRFVEDEHMKEEFHTSFCTTQKDAFRFARKFNERLELISQVKGGIGGLLTIKFLDCNVYGLSASDDPVQGDDFERFLLVEELLDKKKYKKWNSNCGFVDGKQEENSGKAELEIEDPWENRSRKVSFSEKLEQIIPNSTAPDRSYAKKPSIHNDDNEEKCSLTYATPSRSQKNIKSTLLQSSVSDYLQAFSHWTYVYSKREKLVCDLQGVFDELNNVVSLTDPVIHCEENRGKKTGNAYGRTNQGRSGMDSFFKSHTCTPVCKVLGIDPRTIN
jgi:hypothetical protein